MLMKWFFAVVMAILLHASVINGAEGFLQKTTSIKISRKAQFFRADDGSMLVFDSDERKLYRSDDGKKFYELYYKMSTYDGPGGLEKGSAYDHWTDNKSEVLVKIKGDSATLEAKIFKGVKRQPRINAVLLPTVRIPEYLFRLEDGRLLYVSADLYRYTYESFKLFAGNGDSMKKIRLKETPERLRDGGTTTIITGEGTLFSPYRGKPTWKGKIIERLEPREFSITETDDEVKIIRK